MASTHESLRQRAALRSATVQLARPFGVAASRDALGPEVARRVRGEMDHETMRINIARAAALVDPPVTIDDLELEAQDYTVMKWPVRAVDQLGQHTKIAPCCR